MADIMPRARIPEGLVLYYCGTIFLIVNLSCLSLNILVCCPHSFPVHVVKRLKTLPSQKILWVSLSGIRVWLGFFFQSLSNQTKPKNPREWSTASITLTVISKLLIQRSTSNRRLPPSIVSRVLDLGVAHCNGCR